jgi:hypothetical protein
VNAEAFTFSKTDILFPSVEGFFFQHTSMSTVLAGQSNRMGSSTKLFVFLSKVRIGQHRCELQITRKRRSGLFPDINETGWESLFLCLSTIRLKRGRILSIKISTDWVLGYLKESYVMAGQELIFPYVIRTSLTVYGYADDSTCSVKLFSYR